MVLIVIFNNPPNLFNPRNLWIIHKTNIHFLTLYLSEFRFVKLVPRLVCLHKNEGVGIEKTPLFQVKIPFRDIFTIKS